MRFLDFPDWVGQLALTLDLTKIGWVFIVVSLIHLVLIFFLSRGRENPTTLLKLLVCLALTELPLVTLFLLWVAGLPKP